MRAMRRFAFSGDVACLEIARGHDGFLRGNPEPVVIFATYLVSGGDAHVVGRSLHRFRANSPFPSAAAADQTALPSCCADLGEAVAPDWTVLALGLEEDGGKDVQRLFGAVEHHKSLSLWLPDSGEVEPVSLGGLPITNEWDVPREVQLLVEGSEVGDTCRSDKWIGAVCWRVHGREAARRCRFRLPFLAEDRKNDWTLIVDISS